MSAAFSDGVDNVLTMLRFPREGRSSFPRGWRVEYGHIGKSEPVRDWFVRCVSEHLKHDVRRCQVAGNLAMFAVLHWRGSKISYANCQALVTTGATLEDYYLGAACHAQYLRLDYDLGALGGMFREPAPHVHVSPDGEPRFALPPSRNIVIDFLDFIYRNYLHTDWLDWAESVWKANARSRGLDVDAFVKVRDGFGESRYDVLKARKKELGYMKQGWRKKKDELWPHRVSSEEIEILSYEP